MDASSSSSSAAAAPPAHQSVLDTIQTKLSPGVLLVVAILAVVFFIFGLLNLLVQNILRLRRARRRRLRVGDASGGDASGGDGSPTALQGQLQQLFHLHDAGVDQAFIDALPVFLYRDIVKGGKEEEDGGPFDCAVCLCEFAMDDGLRLLPTCGHAFHVTCIDAWLLSHSTCPLCRGSVLDLAPEPSSPALLVLEPGSHAEVTAMEAPGVDNEEGQKAEEEEVVEVKLGKLRCVGANGVNGDLAMETTTSRSSDDNGNDGRRSLGGQRRCLSMGSYEYVMAGRAAALRVAIKTPNKKLQGSSRSRRRRHALSDFDFGFGSAKKSGAAPAWEAAVKDAPAAAGRLKKDSFSVSKIWMVPAAAGRKEDGRALVGGGSRRSVSFRWPAMAAEASRNDNEGGVGNEERRDVEAQPGAGSSTGNIAGERTAPLWAAGGWQPSSS